MGICDALAKYAAALDPSALMRQLREHYRKGNIAGAESLMQQAAPVLQHDLQQKIRTPSGTIYGERHAPPPIFRDPTRGGLPIVHGARTVGHLLEPVGSGAEAITFPGLHPHELIGANATKIYPVGSAATDQGLKAKERFFGTVMSPHLARLRGISLSQNPELRDRPVHHFDFVPGRLLNDIPASEQGNQLRDAVKRLRGDVPELADRAGYQIDDLHDRNIIVEQGTNRPRLIDAVLAPKGTPLPPLQQVNRSMHREDAAAFLRKMRDYEPSFGEPGEPVGD
jgi:hypothetical protein